jgi:hypothetical protein
MRASLLAALLLSTAVLPAQCATFRVPEFAQPITISLGHNAPNGAGFNTLTIRADGHATTFHPRNAVACAPSVKEDRKKDISRAGIEGMQLDSSLCFFTGQFGADMAKHTLLAFVSEGGASDAAPVLVIGFDANGLPYKVLERDELDLTSLISKPDGSALLIGKPTLSQVMASLDYNSHKDPYATTYDPFAVYIITAGKPATYSLVESRSYNVEHYVWAGPKSSESYSVLYNIPGHSKPFGASAREADEILSRAEKERKQ